ncbi:UDP-glucuronosyl/UDP-glucosyltransferase [Trinorchestia longiramus]|nr:UDP-glucuronosyl/UDP-glucosyltransferase [Trinorchestia longiramus]
MDLVMSTVRNLESKRAWKARCLGEDVNVVSVLGAINTDLKANISWYHYNLSFEEFFDQPWFEHVTQPRRALKHNMNLAVKFAQDAFDKPDVKYLYNKRKSFDMIIFDNLVFLALYPFAYEQNFALYFATLQNPIHSVAVGNIQSPAYLSSIIEDYPRPFSTSNRLKNLFFTILSAYLWRTGMRSPIDEEVWKRFPNLPSSYELENNASITFSHSHHALDASLPLLPNQVMIGGMQLKPGRPLPHDLNTFLASDEDAIYVSFGSLIRPSMIPAGLRKILFSVFRSLPYRIILKFEGTIQPEDQHANILMRDWLPQQDILAHPKTKLFLSHCGLNGVNEAIYHSVPLICLPFMGDQIKIASILYHKGIGIKLKWNELTEEILYSSILEVLTDPGYQERVNETSKIFKDQINTPLERAVFWTEYAIRHGGAKHLHSSAKDMSWIEIFYLDILLYAFILFYIAFRVLIPKLKRLGTRLFSKLRRMCTSTETSERSKKRK